MFILMPSRWRQTPYTGVRWVRQYSPSMAPRYTSLQHGGGGYRGLKKWQRYGAGAAAVGAYLYGPKRAASARSRATSRRKFRQKKKYRSNRKGTIKKRVKKLEREVNQNTGNHIYRSRQTARPASNYNGSANNLLASYTVTSLQTAMAALKYFDPANPTVLISANAASGTYHRDVFISGLSSKVRVVNNYQTRAIVTVYCCVPKKDTSITPLLAITNGLTDVGAPLVTSPMIYPEDSPQFKEVWSVKVKKTAQLNIGQSMALSAYWKGFEYDPSLIDDHALAYQRKFGGHYWFARVQSVIAHKANGDINNTNVALDVEIINETRIRYAAGVDVKTIELVDGATGFVAQADGLFGYKSVPDQLPYSGS